MSSYNNIRKIKYTKSPSDVVTLQEYIIFEDSHAKEKFVVFKFANNVNQRLLGFKFEVLQYNGDNELLEKSIVVHENFVAEANDLFVPNAKLKVNFGCVSLEVKLVSASFDRVAWNEGEFFDNSYRFDKYAERALKPAKAAKHTDSANKKTESKKQKHKKLGFNIKNIFRRNKASFPAVFNVILSIIVIGLIVASTFYFKNVTGAFAIDDFIVVENSGYVTILEYVGDDDAVEIPSMLSEYTVDKIAKGAFTDSDIRSIEFQTTSRLFTVETGAFVGCNNLIEVTAQSNCNKITLMEGAFTDCTALTTFKVPTAELCSKCFYGTDNIRSLAFNNVVFSGGRLLDIFNELASITFDYLSMNVSVSASFLEGVTFKN